MDDAPVMLVAGGSGSIGRVIGAQALAAGWRVALHGRSTASTQAVLPAQEGLKAFGADFAEPGQIEQLVAAVGDWAGRIDAVVDCTTTGPKGARITGLFADTDPAAYADFLSLSLASLQRLAHASLPWLTARGGTLVAFGSDAARFAAARQSIIGAARAGTVGFVRNLAVEAARDGVRVHAVLPSFVAKTGAAQRAGGERMAKAAAKAGLGLPTPEDIAPLVLFLCGDGARRITGQMISINGGMNA